MMSLTPVATSTGMVVFADLKAMNIRHLGPFEDGDGLRGKAFEVDGRPTTLVMLAKSGEIRDAGVARSGVSEKKGWRKSSSSLTSLGATSQTCAGGPRCIWDPAWAGTCEHKPPHQLGMVEGDVLCDGPTHRPAQQIYLLESEAPDERDCSLGHALHGRGHSAA